MAKMLTYSCASPNFSFVAVYIVILSVSLFAGKRTFMVEINSITIHTNARFCTNLRIFGV